MVFCLSMQSTILQGYQRCISGHFSTSLPQADVALTPHAHLLVYRITRQEVGVLPFMCHLRW
jgi:hypothetical protein